MAKPDDELLPPNDGSTGADKAPRNVKCDFCGCRLTRQGEIISMGAEAKAMQKSETTIEALRESLAQAEGAGETYKREADTLRAQLADAQKKPAETGW